MFCLNLDQTYALTMSPVAMSLEELIPSTHLKSHIFAIIIRTSLVISTLIVGLTIPFFGKPLLFIVHSFTQHLNSCYYRTWLLKKILKVESLADIYWNWPWSYPISIMYSYWKLFSLVCRFGNVIDRIFAHNACGKFYLLP